MNIRINQTYKGRYEPIKVTPSETVFSSAQKVTAQEGESELELTAINWTVDSEGNLSGKASFFSTLTPDKVDAELRGISPNPPQGQGYREAHVNVMFAGGTGAYEKATGSAVVNARLYADGYASGTIDGTVEITTEGAERLESLKGNFLR